MYENKPVIAIIASIGNYLREELPRDQAKLRDHLAGLEAQRMELLEVTVDWKMLLAEKKSQYLHPKDANLTELDRTTMLNASIANIQRDVSFLEVLVDLVTQRIQLGKTIY